MIAEYLDRDYVLAQLRAQRDSLVTLLHAHDRPGPAGDALRAHVASRQLDAAQIRHVVHAYTVALQDAAHEPPHPPGTAYIPSNPVICAFQAGMTEALTTHHPHHLEDNPPVVVDAAAVDREGTDKPAQDTSAPQRLNALGRRFAAQGPTLPPPSPALAPGPASTSVSPPVAGPAPEVAAAASPSPLADTATQVPVPAVAPASASPPLIVTGLDSIAVGDGTPASPGRGSFIEGKDSLYTLEWIKSKMTLLFHGPHPFNDRPARIARTPSDLTLHLFGDWGTGLPLARAVTARIREQLAAALPGPDAGPGPALPGTRQHHVIHLGDVYYTGEIREYHSSVLDDGQWPVSGADTIATVGSWSLNGNHDRYSGCYGYFDTLLTAAPFQRWHQDDQGRPSSFFLIENDDWQVFGLDTAWNVPSLADSLVATGSLTEVKGQDGELTPAQVAWMAQERRPAKGAVLLTHHQPASSRRGEAQQADAAIAALVVAGVYTTLDAWIWGHEHRAVVFKPRDERQHPVLRHAPAFCACLGHAGVPVTQANFKAGAAIDDVLWQEDRFDAANPVYDGVPVLRFGFARLDTRPGGFTFILYDHTGAESYRTDYARAREQPAVLG